MQNVRDRRYDLGLPDSRYPLQQHVALGKQADQRSVDDFPITDDDSGDLFLDDLELVGEFTDPAIDTA